MQATILDFFMNNQNFSIILIVVLIERLKNYTSGNIAGVWIANFIGTFFHELAHFVVSVLLFGKPVKVSLFPKKQENGYVLGYVESSNVTWYNALPISLAPLVLIPVAFYFKEYFFVFVDQNVYTYLLEIFITATLLENAIPSLQDFKVAFSNIGFIFYIAIVAAYFYYYKGFTL
ncbi:hypothetical protein [Sulfurimonas indica]|uniref:hypothetical protein n=1 Tax=Sulfurimonas indica TaxID=2508707 RepID=UPI00165F7D1C|nr:hypothetical protein [Sulfurimonas indica]